MGFAENILRLQEEHGETNYALAKALGVSQSSIANWKKGTIPHKLCLDALANHFGVTVDDLLNPDQGKETT